ncbi:helix-turn-helix transcriptional regulator [Leptospira venezuelensis]|uniref:helix-turn-helix domain-containing protein n=1 Tax=Leptospira venezuelensis TaxID=1958811 RepID=UPI0012FFA47E|nr:helix-turn-helix transcriptional regulator [Leptospira venezuelensis]
MTNQKEKSLIGQKTLAIIEASGESQTNVAPLLKLSKAGLNNLIKGRIESPSKSFLEAIVEVFKVDLNWFLDDSKPVHPISYIRKSGEKASQMDDETILLNHVRNSKGIKEIIKNLINLSAKEVNTWAELISEYTKMKEETKKK